MQFLSHGGYNHYEFVSQIGIYMAQCLTQYILSPVC